MYLQEDQVNTQKLVEIFTSAFMDVSGIEENRFGVTGVKFPFLIGIIVRPESKAIQFFYYHQLDRISEQEAALICNKLNHDAVFCKYYIFTHQGDVMLTFESVMTYEKGLIPYQLVANFRLFEHMANHGVKRFSDYI